MEETYEQDFIVNLIFKYMCQVSANEGVVFYQPNDTANKDSFHYTDKGIELMDAAHKLYEISLNPIEQ